MSDYQNRETRESSTGAKLLSAYPRALVTAYLGTPLAPIILPGGFSTQDVAIPRALVPPGPAPGNEFPIRQNLRYKFSGNASFSSASPADVSIESAGLLISFNSLRQYFQAARLSSLTALAEKAPISFDEWLIDCNDFLAASDVVHGNQERAFGLYVRVNVNKVGGPTEFYITANVQIAAANFDSYRFDKWE